MLLSAHLLSWDLPAAPLTGLITRLPHTQLGGDLVQLLSLLVHLPYACGFLCSETIMFLHQIFYQGLKARISSWPTLVLGECPSALLCSPLLPAVLTRLGRLCANCWQR